MTNRNQKDKPGSVGRHVPLYADTPADLEFDEPSNQCSLITLYEQDAPPRTVPQGQEHYIEVGRYYWIRFDTRGYYWTYCILRLTLHCTPIRVYPSHSYHPPSRALQVDQSKLMNILKCPICLGVFKETVSTANGPSSSALLHPSPTPLFLTQQVGLLSCIHRFCNACITPYLSEVTNNSCPICRSYCSTKRHTRTDENLDSLISKVMLGREDDIGAKDDLDDAFKKQVL